MKFSRQIERRARFQFALSKMPLWETWETSDAPDIQPSERDDLVSMYDLSAVFPSEPGEPPRIRHHCKVIPRRVRRSMARDLAKREFRNERELSKSDKDKYTTK